MEAVVNFLSLQIIPDYSVPHELTNPVVMLHSSLGTPSG